MALPVGTSLLSKTQAAGLQWQDPQKIGKARRPQMRWLSVRCNDQATLVRQRVQVFSRSLCRNQARGDYLCQSNDFNRGGVLSPTEGDAYQEALQVPRHFCGQLLTSALRAPPNQQPRTKSVPAKVSLRLHAFKNEPIFNLNFNYRSVVGKLNYLTQTTCPDIMYAIHQISKYSSDPCQSHGEATMYLICYLKKTPELGIRFKSDPKKGFECYCDADFSGLWNKTFAPVDPSTSKSRSG